MGKVNSEINKIKKHFSYGHLAFQDLTDLFSQMDCYSNRNK